MTALDPGTDCVAVLARGQFHRDQAIERTALEEMLDKTFSRVSLPEPAVPTIAIRSSSASTGSSAERDPRPSPSRPRSRRSKPNLSCRIYRPKAGREAKG